MHANPPDIEEDDDELEKKPEFPMRINKYLARERGSTRREMDELIKQKRVFINGTCAVLGDRVGEKDKVEVKFRGIK